MSYKVLSIILAVLLFAVIAWFKLGEVPINATPAPQHNSAPAAPAPPSQFNFKIPQ